MRVVFSLVFLLLPGTPLVGQTDSLNRVRSHELWIPLAGRAVIQDSADWAVLWHRFGEIGYREGELVRLVPPEIDFENYLLVVVSMGTSSGCSNQARYIQRIEAQSDSTIVKVGPEDLGPEFTCMMEINPVDVVRLPRGSPRIVFQRYWDDVPVPGPANWWQTPSAQELDDMTPQEREVFLLALAQDPNTSSRLLQAVAERLSETDWTIGDILVERPAVQQNSEALYALTRVRGTSTKARRILLEKHGEELARDPETPKEVLSILLRELLLADPYPAIARLLLHNPTIRLDQRLLRDFTHYAQHYRDLRLEACRLYLDRWPRTIVLERDSTGRPVKTVSATCP